MFFCFIANTNKHRHTCTHIHTIRVVTYHSAGVVGISLQIAGCLPALACMATTCFSLGQQMVQPPPHYSCSFFLLIHPCFSSLPTCLCLLIFSFTSLFVLVSVPFFFFWSACLAASSLCVCMCTSFWFAEGCLCYIEDRLPSRFSLSLSPNRERHRAFLFSLHQLPI